MYYLTIEFKNAKWFNNNNYKPVDQIFDLDGRRPRYDKLKKFLSPYYKCPIHYNHVSNMLHVLMGQQPAASLRKTIFKPIESILDVAKNSYVRLDLYNSELINTKKCLTNSHVKVITYCWAYLEKYLREDFINLKTAVEKEFNIKITDYTVNQVVNMAKQRETPVMDEYFKVAKYLSIYNLFKTEKDTGIHYHPLAKLTTNNGIVHLTKLSGEIIVKVSAEQLDMIKNHKGCATILDGGLATIKSVVKESRFNEESLTGFKKITDYEIED